MTVAPAAVGKLVVVGVGLIGGSFALALKAAGAVGEVVGVGRSRANLDTALAQGVCDRALTLDEAWTRELATADVVLVATPVGELPALFAAIAPRARARDAGDRRRQHQAGRRRCRAHGVRRIRARALRPRAPDRRAPSTRVPRPRLPRCTATATSC